MRKFIEAKLATHEHAGLDRSIDMSTYETAYNVDIALKMDDLKNLEEILGGSTSSKINDAIFYNIVQDIDKVVYEKVRPSADVTILEDGIGHTALKKFLDDEMLNAFDGIHIITNGACGATIQDLPNFKQAQKSFTQITTNGCTYYFGDYDKIPLYVNPYLRWDDNSITTVYNRYFNYSFEFNSKLEDSKYVNNLINSNTPVTLNIGVIEINYVPVHTNSIRVTNLLF